MKENIIHCYLFLLVDIHKVLLLGVKKLVFDICSPRIFKNY